MEWKDTEPNGKNPKQMIYKSSNAPCSINQKNGRIIVFAFGIFFCFSVPIFFLLYFILLKKFCSFINFPLYFNSSHCNNTTSSKLLKTWNNNNANVNKQWYSIWRAFFVRSFALGYVLVVHQRQSYHVVRACSCPCARWVCVGACILSLTDLNDGIKASVLE